MVLADRGLLRGAGRTARSWLDPGRRHYPGEAGPTKCEDAEEPLFVQGSLRSTSSVSSGIVGRISVNDTQVWQRAVAARDTQPQPIQALATVRVGDAVNLLLARRLGG